MQVAVFLSSLLKSSPTFLALSLDVGALQCVSYELTLHRKDDIVCEVYCK